MFNYDEEFTEMINLGFDDLNELNLMKSNKIFYRKKLGKLLSKSRKDAKNDECYYCGKKCSSFCNSHSIPSFSLKNIAVNGDVYSNNKLIKLPLLDEDQGVNKSGIFHLICHDCDSKIFSDYENPENYKTTPTHRMIAQIAMKNYLKNISKRQLEMAIYKNMKADYSMPQDIYDLKQYVNHLDLKEYIEGFERAKRILEKNWKDEYYLFYCQSLNYVAPIAFQNIITLINDFEGNIINDIYNKSPKYQMKMIHICVLPLKESSTIMMFIDSKDKRYRKFYKQFNRLSHEDKLSAVNYLIFSYSEEVYINKNINEQVLENESLKEIAKKTSQIISSEPIENARQIASENFDFNKMNDVPNLLLEKYKVR